MNAKSDKTALLTKLYLWSLFSRPQPSGERNRKHFDIGTARGSSVERKQLNKRPILFAKTNRKSNIIAYHQQNTKPNIKIFSFSYKFKRSYRHNNSKFAFYCAAEWPFFFCWENASALCWGYPRFRQIPLISVECPSKIRKLENVDSSSMYSSFQNFTWLFHCKY